MVQEMLPKNVNVFAYSGYKANERPVSFIMDDRRIEVRSIVDRWYGIEHDYYKILGDDGKVYLLKWHRLLDLWFVVKILEKMGKH